MEDIKIVTLHKAIRMLIGTGVAFAVIDEKGNKHGNLEVVAPKERKRTPSPNRKRGELINHFLPYVENAESGQVIRIPANQYDIGEVRSSLASWASSVWGKDSYTTHILRDQRIIEILRF